MKEILRSTDLVLMSHAISILSDEGIMAFELDRHMSVLEGSIGILPRRLMVADRDAFMAAAILREAGLCE